MFKEIVNFLRLEMAISTRKSAACPQNFLVGEKCQENFDITILLLKIVM